MRAAMALPRLVAAALLLGWSLFMLRAGAAPAVVFDLLVTLGAALLVALVVKRVDPDLVWFSSPLVAGIGMALAGNLTGTHGDSLLGAIIGAGASTTVPFLAGWNDAIDSDFHRFLRRFPVAVLLLGLAALVLGAGWLILSLLAAACWGQPLC